MSVVSQEITPTTMQRVRSALALADTLEVAEMPSQAARVLDDDFDVPMGVSAADCSAAAVEVEKSVDIEDSIACSFVDAQWMLSQCVLVCSVPRARSEDPASVALRVSPPQAVDEEGVPETVMRVIAGANSPGRLVGARETDASAYGVEIGARDADWTKWTVVAVRSSRWGPMDALVKSEGEGDSTLLAGSLLSGGVRQGKQIPPALLGSCCACLSSQCPPGIRTACFWWLWKVHAEQVVTKESLELKICVTLPRCKKRKRSGPATPSARVVAIRPDVMEAAESGKAGGSLGRVLGVQMVKVREKDGREVTVLRPVLKKRRKE